MYSTYIFIKLWIADSFRSALNTKTLGGHKTSIQARRKDQSVFVLSGLRNIVAIRRIRHHLRRRRRHRLRLLGRVHRRQQ